MRMWCGKDVEYNPGHGKMTLFVESENPDIDKIVEVLSSCNYGIDAVYFGAGEIDIKNWSFLTDLYKVSDAFIVGLETSSIVPSDITNRFNFVIVRVPIYTPESNIYIKYRTNNEVGIANVLEFRSNSVFDLQNGQYSCDVEVYNDKE